MKKEKIPDALLEGIKAEGYHARKSKGGKILFWNEPNRKIDITFFNVEKTMFKVRLKIGPLLNKQELRLGLACCLKRNAGLQVAYLVVREGKEHPELCADIDYECHTEFEARAFASMFASYLSFAYETAREYMYINLKEESYLE